MSILFGRPSVEQRSISFQDVWGSGASSTRGVNPLSIVPVYSATGLIADQFASSPCSVFDKTDGGVPARAKVQPQLVRDPGVNGLDIYSWKHQAISSALLRGNAYGYILAWDKQGVPSTVVWLNPNDVDVDESGPSPVFKFKGNVIPRDRLIHIPAYVQAGSVVGLSPLALFKAQIETADAAQTYGKTWFKRGGIPSGVLKNTAKALNAEQASTAKQRFKASVSASDPFVTGSDWDYQAISIPGSEVQFISALELTANQWAAIYRVAPEDVGGRSSGTSLTYKSLEQDMIRFSVRTMRPWTTRFEAVLDRYLFGTQYVRFNLDASVRADLKTRYESHEISIRSGFKTRDEVRELEELPPLTPEQKEAAPTPPSAVGGTDA